jgi:hypothetical protein
MHKNSFKHSGTLGDLIYALPVVQHLGGGDFYLHMNQIDYLSQRYYGVNAPVFHSGRMNINDFEFMKDFMRVQNYITKFEPMDPRTAEITHNLDRFRDLFVRHPGNYVDCYADVFNIKDDNVKRTLRNTAWLDVPSVIEVPDRDVVINRTLRWVPPQLSPIWQDWQAQGVEQRAVFVGLGDEYTAFCQATGWDIPYRPTGTLLEVAQLIAGAKVFIGNQSAALAVALGLGHTDIWCEGRRDLPMERNECYFPLRPGLHYF